MFHSLYMCLPWLCHCPILEKVIFVNFSTAFTSLKAVTTFYIIISSSREPITFSSIL